MGWGRRAYWGFVISMFGGWVGVGGWGYGLAGWWWVREILNRCGCVLDRRSLSCWVLGVIQLKHEGRGEENRFWNYI